MCRKKNTFFICLFYCVFFYSNGQKDYFSKDGKLRGVHFFANTPLSDTSIKNLKKNHIEWLVLVPYGYQNQYNIPTLRSSALHGYELSERDEGIIQISEKAKKNGLRVAIKPHIWLRVDDGGKWRSEIVFDNEQDWNIWQKLYTDWIMRYAQLSKKVGADLFCIGTELRSIVKKHPEFWRRLIKEVKKVYTGKLCYAANWYEEYKEVKFWDELDYIGIQAYFPIAEKQGVSKQILKAGWKKHIEEITKIQKSMGKPVLFTEIGYKSTTDAAIEPWQWPWDQEKFTLSYSSQTICYQAFFEMLWKEKWFKGVLIWQWRNEDFGGRFQGKGFTPQKKPALGVIKQWFGNSF